MSETGTQTSPPAATAPPDPPSTPVAVPDPTVWEVNYHYHFHFTPDPVSEPSPPAQPPQPLRATLPNLWNVSNVTPVRRARGRPTNAERQLRAQVEALLQNQRHATLQAGALPGAAAPQPVAFPGHGPAAPQPVAFPGPGPSTPQPAAFPGPAPAVTPQPAAFPRPGPAPAVTPQPVAFPGPGPFATPQPVAFPGPGPAATPQPAATGECLICRSQADSILSTCWHSVCEECMLRWLVRRRACPDPRCAVPCTAQNIIRSGQAAVAA